MRAAASAPGAAPAPTVAPTVAASATAGSMATDHARQRAATARHRADAEDAVDPLQHAFGGAAAASGALLSAVDARLSPQLSRIRQALGSGKPTAEACDASLEVLLALAPLLGPLEPAARQIAAFAHRASRALPRRSNEPLQAGYVGAEEPISGLTTRPEHAAGLVPHYFAATEALEQAIEELTREKEKALAESREQLVRIRQGEKVLNATKGELETLRDRIDAIMKSDAVNRTKLGQLKEKQAGQDARLNELIEGQGHVYRVGLEDERVLRERIEDMKRDAERQKLLGLAGGGAAQQRGLDAHAVRQAAGRDGGERTANDGASVPSGARSWSSAEAAKRRSATRLKGASIAAALAASPPRRPKRSTM